MLGGMQTEGIFRVPADAEELNMLKILLDRWEFPENTGTMGIILIKPQLNFVN